MGHWHKRSTQGFSLIELVVVIIVLAILAAAAIPKFVNRSGFEDYTVRDQLIARLRLVQLQGMNADPASVVSKNACYWLVVNKKDSCFYHEHTTKSGGNCSVPTTPNVCITDDYNEFGRISFPVGMLDDARVVYRFDLQGKLVPYSTEKEKISIKGDNDLSVIIESEGFIHE